MGAVWARDINLDTEGKVEFTDVDYTSCPVGNDSWMLHAGLIDLDTRAQLGVAHNVVMRFKDVPIFYTPYISFPLGDERKSGILFPSFGHSGSNGYELEIPYYFNIAPNYDLTFTPGYLSARGVQLAEDFRFLTSNSHGFFDATFSAERQTARFGPQLPALYRCHRPFAPVCASMRTWRPSATAIISSIFPWARTRPASPISSGGLDLLYDDDYWQIRTQLQKLPDHRHLGTRGARR